MLSLSLYRCVKGEGEIEKLQTKVVELRRKLDDTTAAMQELGRENQSLQVGWETPSEQNPNRFESILIDALFHPQIKQSQSLTRKWAEDHEVQNCMACGKVFSVTLRKVRVDAH